MGEGHNMNFTNFRRLAGKAALALSLAVVAVPVYSQTVYTVNPYPMIQKIQSEAKHECMLGQLEPKTDMFADYPSAVSSIRGYWDAVKTGSPVSVAPFFNVSKNASWSSETINVPITLEEKITDPFAVPGAQLAEKPLRTFRASKGASLHTQWEVRGEAGVLIGTYDAELLRKGSVWRLQSMKLIPAKQYVEPLVQYCYAVGDVMPYRQSRANGWIEFASERLLELETKADIADAELAQLRSRSSASNTGDSVSQLTGQMEKKAMKAREKASEAKLDLEAAERELARVKSDIRAMDDARAAGIAKLGGG
jgi:hypothetical protein